ncbi:MAG TPA: nickel-binding protein [Streptosporangiaceae bacterium]|nr:nickel-binding protein [Streptosporangiaceae bacterium]
MALFLVFRDLPGVTRDQYSAAQRAAADAARRARADGRRVAYRGGFFVVAAGRAICVFDAETATDVAAVNDLAGLPVTSIAEAIELRTTTDSPPS